MKEGPNSNIIVNYLMGEGVVAYQRGLARAIGDHSAGLLLSQFWYWAERQPKERDGWFFMTQEQIYEETVMTRREQETARRKLRELGVLEENKRGVPAKLWYRVNTQAVVSLLENYLRSQYGGKRHTSMAENDILECRNPSSKFGTFCQTIESKTTPKITPKNTATADASITAKVSPAISSAAAVSSGKEFHPESFALLQAQGFDDEAARRLAVHPAEHIQKQIELLAQRKPSQNPLGLLRRAIEGNYGVPNKAIKPAQTKSHASGKDPAARAREAQKRDVEDYAVYREQQRATLKAHHADAYRAYEQKNAEKRAEIARRAPHSMELTMFDKRGIEEPRFAEFFRQYAPCPVLPFDEWVQAGKPRGEEGEAVPFALTIPDLSGLNAAL